MSRVRGCHLGLQLLMTYNFYSGVLRQGQMLKFQDTTPLLKSSLMGLSPAYELPVLFFWHQESCAAGFSDLLHQYFIMWTNLRVLLKLHLIFFRHVRDQTCLESVQRGSLMVYCSVSWRQVFATAKQNPERRDRFIDFIYRNQDFNSAWALLKSKKQIRSVKKQGRGSAD